MTTTKFLVKPCGKLYFIDSKKNSDEIDKDLSSAINKSGMTCQFVRRMYIKNRQTDKKILCYEYDLKINDIPFNVDYNNNSIEMKSYSIFCSELSKKFYELM